MLTVRLYPAGAALLSLAALQGCASAGPDLSGPEGPGIMAAYSGDWVLVPSESEDLNGKLRDSMRETASGMPGGRGGGGGMSGGRPGGGGGGMPPGGGTRGGMPGGGRDPEEMRQAVEVIRGMAQVPGEFSLTLKPETVSFTQDAGNGFLLSLGAESERILQGGATILGKAKWTKDGVEIQRGLELGPGIKDKISLNDEGKLILKREIELMGGAVKGTLVYQRK
jgi:hypothetical protein